MKPFDKLLVLDLDETLIYSSESRLGREPDYTAGPFFIYTRPHVNSFLNTCLEWFKVGIWTSATEVYANNVTRYLISDTDVLEFIWSRSRCTRVRNLENGKEYFIKDLKKLKRKSYDLAKIIVIEDSWEAVQRNYGNSILVSSYHGEEDDTELMQLLRYLEILGPANNVRRIDKRNWKYTLG